MAGARRGRHEASEPSLARRLAPAAAFAALMLLKVLAVRFVALGDPDPLRGLALEGGFLLLPVAALGAVFPRLRRWAWLAVDAALSLACVAVLVFAAAFEQVPTLGAIRVAGELEGQSAAVVALLRPAYAAFFADLPALAVLLARRRDAPPHRARPDRPLAAVALVSLLWVSLVLAALAVRGGADDSTVAARESGLLASVLFEPPSEQVSSASFSLPAPAAASAGTSTPGMPSAAPTAPPAFDATPAAPALAGEPVDLRDPVSVQAHFDALQSFAGSVRVTGAPEPGTAEGRPVILIQAESLSSCVLEMRVGREEVTPHLNRLIRTSWCAPHMVYQTGRGNTSDAEFVANTSLLADRDLPSSYLWRGKAIPSLPRLVRVQGYRALTFHTNEVRYWRRDLMYPSLGFTRFYADPDFPDTDVIGKGASDRVLFARTAEILESQPSGKPFLAEVVTMSGHFPYYFAAPKGDLDVPKALRWTVLGEYVQAMRYQDAQLGAFLDRLRRDGLWDEAVVIVYGDHFGIRPFGWSSAATELTPPQRAAFAEWTGRAAAAADSFEVPLVVHLPGQTEGRMIEETRAQVDIMPTVADLLGIDLARTPHIGASLFDARERTAVMRYHAPDGTFVSRGYLFRPGRGYRDGTVIDLSTSRRVPRSRVSKAEYERVHRLCALSRAYLRSLPALGAPR